MVPPPPQEGKAARKGMPRNLALMLLRMPALPDRGFLPRWLKRLKPTAGPLVGDDDSLDSVDNMREEMSPRCSLCL